MPWNDDQMLELATVEFVNAIEHGCDVDQWVAYNRDPLGNHLPYNCTLWLIWSRIMHHSARQKIINFHTKNGWCTPERLLRVLARVEGSVPWERVRINGQPVPQSTVAPREGSC